MWPQRGWPALLAIWTILAQLGQANGAVLSLEKKGNEIFGTENIEKIYSFQPNLGPSVVRRPSDPAELESRKSRIRKTLENSVIREANNDFYSTSGKRRKRKATRLEGDKYTEWNGKITETVGLTLNEEKVPVELGKHDTGNIRRGKFNPQSAGLQSHEEDEKLNKYEKQTLVTNVARGPGSIESKESSLDRKDVELGNDKAYLSFAEGGEKLKAELSSARKNEMVIDNTKSQSLGGLYRNMQRENLFSAKGKNPGSTIYEGIDRKYTRDFVTSGKALSAKSQIVTDYQPTRESFNDPNPKTNWRTNVNSASYRDSNNPRKVESSISSKSREPDAEANRILQSKYKREERKSSAKTTPLLRDLKEIGKHSKDSISVRYNGIFNKGKDEAQGTIECIGKTKFNKKLPIGLAAVNYRRHVGAESLDSNIERTPIPKYEPEESYRRTDVARDMSRVGGAALGVGYLEDGLTGAGTRESAVEKIDVSHEVGVALLPVSSRFVRSEALIPHTPPTAIQTESHGIPENSKSRLIKNELLNTSWEEIHTRGEISVSGRGNLLKTDKTLSETTSGKYLNNNKSHPSSLLAANSEEVISGHEHPTTTSTLLRIKLIKPAETSSSKENEYPGIIENPKSGYPGTIGKKTINRDGDRNDMTTALNIRATGTLADSYAAENNEQSKELGEIRVKKISEKGNALELHEEGNISKENSGGESPLRIRTPNFLDNQSYPVLKIMRPIKTDLMDMEIRRGSNDTDKFQFVVKNSAVIEGDENVAKEDVGGGKSGNNIHLESHRDGEAVRDSKFIVQSSEEIEMKVSEYENSSRQAKKIEEDEEIEDTREKLASENKKNINLWHVLESFESNTHGNTTGNGKIDINATLSRTTTTEASTQNGVTQGLSFTVNLLSGEKNDGELRGRENGGVSWTGGNKKTNLLDKLWDSKPKVVNLSALDVSGYEFLTERYFKVDEKNNDQAKLSEKMTGGPEIVFGKQTLSQLNQRRKFSLEYYSNAATITPRSLITRLSDKYLASKNKRDMKSSGSKLGPISGDEKIIKNPVGGKEATVTFPPNLQEISIISQSKVTDPKDISIRKIVENNTSSKETGTTPRSGGKPKKLLPESGDGGGLGSTTENFRPLENLTEMNVFSENKSPVFNDDNPGSEKPAVSYSRIITSESNQTYSNHGDANIASRKILKALAPFNSDLVDQDILSSFTESLLSTETPLKTTLDIFQAISQSLNPSFSFNQTDLDNTSRVSTALNQWPVKHSAVVEGDLVLGGLMMVHEREDSVTCGPVMPQGGVQALEAMLYTLDRLNEEEIIPGVKIGAHILDDCDKDTYGLEMAVDFIKGSISNIDGAEYHCNKTAVRKVISGVVGAASSVTSIQVANLLRLFRIPQVSFFSTSPELSNKQRFEYFTRTIPSDHYQVKAMVDIVRKMNWSYVSIIYEESNYGIKAFEELEELLDKYDICIAIKEKLVKDSGVAEETAYDNIVQKLLTKPRARGCIIFGSDQEVAGVMRAVRRCNATGAFSWIGSDGWSARGLVSDGNEAEVEGTLSVQPQANPVKGFEKYFLDLTVENNRRNPWFVEFWEDHFQCRYPNTSWTPYNQKYTEPCTTKEKLDKNNTAIEDQLQFVSDAVTAFAYAFRDMHNDLCHGKHGLCDAMKPTKGTELLKYLRKVEFEGLSGDKFKFDKNGDGPARYNIIHFKQVSPGEYKWVRVGEYMEGELRLNMSEIQFRLGRPLPPESVCSLPCEVGQAKKYVEGESCCWHCFNCTQYQVRDRDDETQCIPCPQGRVPDETHSNCRDLPEEFLRPESGWAIGAMSFSATGILVTLFVGGVFLRHNDTPVVRASGRELSYVLLTGILLCYLVTFALVLRPNNLVCGIQRFGAGFCFTVVYAALLTKTNRIARIFNAGKQSAKRPSFISPRSQLIICSGLMGVQVLINGVWMIIDPAKAMHHYPTREDNLLVCSSYIDASYMIAFAYPIILIVVCTVYAVLTRKIPEAFNESKHIGFTMYTTCVIWLAFVPLYFGTGNHVALRITSMSVTISLSASVTIACLFSPKLYIILIRSERNVRQSMMPAKYGTTKSSGVTGTNAPSVMAAVTLTAATCDQNKAVKRHVTPTIDCSTQSEHYEMEVRKDRINGKTPANFVSKSTQTGQVTDSQLESNSTRGVAGAGAGTKDASSKDVIKDNSSLGGGGKQVNNVRIGNGPVSQTDGGL